MPGGLESATVVVWKQHPGRSLHKDNEAANQVRPENVKRL